MPLMTDWSNSLLEEIETIETGLAKAIHLEPDLAGDDFEQRLGEFLALDSSISLAERFSTLGMTVFGAQEPYIFDWSNRARSRFSQIVETIRTNLYSNFGYERFDDDLAKSAYEGLLSALAAAGANAPHLWFATTNYDCAIEAAFRLLKFQVMDGFPESGLRTPVLDAQGIAHSSLQSTGITPVLHLHGAVGWYAKPTGNIQRLPPDQPYNATLGTPALLLPDNTKSAASLVGGEILWREFEQMLENSTHVMFLGHSLNDKHLVEVVRRFDKPTVVVWKSDSPESEVIENRKLMNERLPNALLTAGDFRPKPKLDVNDLKDWLAS